MYGVRKQGTKPQKIFQLWFEQKIVKWSNERMIEADLKRYQWRNWTIFSGYFVSTLMRAKYANTTFVKWILEQRGTLLWRSLLTADAWSFWKIANLWQPIKYLQRNFTVKQYESSTQVINWISQHVTFEKIFWKFREGWQKRKRKHFAEKKLIQKADILQWT